MVRNPVWIAQRHGQDWRDENCLAAIAWLTRVVPAQQWRGRIDKVRETFEVARGRWVRGEREPLYDPADLIAWYVFQAGAYAAERTSWVEHEAYRVSPVFRRLGQLLPVLQTVGGIDERIERLMTDARQTPDNGIYELLVAGAYRSRGWTEVSFVRELPGVSRTHELDVYRDGERWAVECKRVGRSGYAADERTAGDLMAGLAHRECALRGASAIVEVIFTEELAKAGECYLADHVADFLAGGSSEWIDEIGRGRIRPVDWGPMNAVLHRDDVYFGSSRMIELLTGTYQAHVDTSVDGDWTSAAERPFHATALRRASVVQWLSVSELASRRKARHFRSMVADAVGQLPGDRPGVVHVGYEAVGGNTVDNRRHALNLREMATFEPGASRLQWVYGNYMTPEHTVARNESAAISETTATYPVGHPEEVEPLPSHLLFSNTPGRPGHHWVR